MRLTGMGCFAATLASLTTSANGQAWRPPTEQQRCPSRWGAADERGSVNHMNPSTVLRALRLVKTGEIIELGHVLTGDMPLPATRRFDVHTKRTIMNPQSNRRGSNEEIVIAEIGQVGTQFDAFPHQTIGEKIYNCVKLDDIAGRTGFTKFGVDRVGALVTRGVLIDVAGLKGVETLPDNYEISVDDLQQALRRERITLHAGDAIIINTGWGRLWGKEKARFLKSSPGIGIQAAEWLARQNPMLVGSDNSSVETVPNPDPELSLPVHQIMLVVSGIHLLENLKLDELVDKRAYEFVLVLQPLKIAGGTGSTVAPIAIR